MPAAPSIAEITAMRRWPPPASSSSAARAASSSVRPTNPRPPPRPPGGAPAPAAPALYAGGGPALPQRQRLLVAPAAGGHVAGREGDRPAGRQNLEQRPVEFVATHPQLVAAPGGHQNATGVAGRPAGVERLAQPAHISLHQIDRRGRRILAP